MKKFIEVGNDGKFFDSMGVLGLEHVIKEDGSLDSSFDEVDVLAAYRQFEPAEKVVTAKNVVLARIIREHNLGWNFKAETLPVTCSSCTGRGFHFVPKIENQGKCPDCFGTGIKVRGCRACGGSGYKEGEKCRTCKGRGFYVYHPTKNFQGADCPRCKGTGKLRKFTNTLELAKVCYHCSGTGFPKQGDNPVLPIGIVEKLNLGNAA